MARVTEDEMKIIAEIISEHAPECDVLVFGSRLGTAAKAYSDLDLAFAGSEKLGLKKIMRIEDAFRESDLPYRVDVLDYNAVSPEFRAIIDGRNEKIFTAPPSVRG